MDGGVGAGRGEGEDVAGGEGEEEGGEFHGSGGGVRD